MILDYTLVALVGGVVGLGEIASRITDEPFSFFRNRAAWLYIGINALASIAALLLIRLFDMTFGVEDGESKLRWVQVLVAGFAGVVVMRSSFFTARVGDKEINMGPSGVLQQFLFIIDKEVVRQRGQLRARTVAGIMKGVSFNRAVEELPAISIALIQKLGKEEQDKLVDSMQILQTDGSTLSEHSKALLLGLLLMDQFGEGLLRAAVEVLKQEIARSGDPVDPLRAAAFRMLRDKDDRKNNVAPNDESTA